MLATVKIIDTVQGNPGGPTQFVDVGVIDVRCGTSIQTLLARARSLEFNAPLTANLLDGVQEHLMKSNDLIGTFHNPLPKKKGESFVKSWKRFHHRKTKTYHTVTISVEPLSVPRLDPSGKL